MREGGREGDTEHVDVLGDVEGLELLVDGKGGGRGQISVLGATGDDLDEVVHHGALPVDRFGLRETSETR
jgi:hypothetical protein